MEDALGTATTEQIVDELRKRFPLGLLVCGLAEWPGDADCEKFYCDFTRPTAAIGLATRAAHHIAQKSYTECGWGEEADDDEQGN